MASRAALKRLRALRSRKGRAKQGLCLAEGPRLLAELAAAGPTPVHVLYTSESAEDARLQEMLACLAARGALTDEVSARDLADVADAATPQGVLASVPISPPVWPAADAGRILVLDRIQNPGNVGTLIRTAEALGMDGVLMVRGTADPWSPKAVRAAAGSTFRVPLYAEDWPRIHAGLVERGFGIWAADASGSPITRQDSVPARLALVLGNEGQGLDESIRTQADSLVAIRLAGAVESVNVAVAGALLMDRIFGGRFGA